MTLHRCLACGWVTVNGSLHGCVSCLVPREPEPFDVVPVAEVENVLEHERRLVDALTLIRDTDAALDPDRARRVAEEVLR
jgi:hypothetical protein